MEMNTRIGAQMPGRSEHHSDAMGKDAMQFLYALGCEKRDFVVQEIDGHMYTNSDDLHVIEPIMPLELEPMDIFTLDGLVSYILEDPDKLFDKFGRLVLSVRDESHVYLYSVAYGPENAKRSMLASCVMRSKAFAFNTYCTQEDFIVRLQSLFVRTDNRDKVGKVVGNLAAEQGVNTSDDGISQRVVVKNGIARMGDVVIENPVPLVPYRSFPEIEQVESPFVLRIKSEEGQKEPRVALFEADGDMWRREAVQRIGCYLADKLEPLLSNRSLTLLS